MVNKYYKDRRILKLFSGLSLSYLIILSATPILSRLYEPSNFGKLGVFMSIQAVLALVTTFKYEFSIPVAKKDFTAWNLLLLSLLLCLCSSLFLLALILFLWCIHFQIIAKNFLEIEAFLAPLGVLATATVATTEHWLNRKDFFGWVSLSRFVGTLFMTGIQVFLGKILPNNQFGLILGLIGGIVLMASMNLYRTWDSRPSNLFHRKKWKKLLVYTAMKFERFPKYLLPAQSINTLANHLPTLLIGSYFGATAAGLYLMFNRAVAMFDLYPTAIGQVFFVESSKRYVQSGECYDIFKSNLLVLSATAIIFTGFSLAFLPKVFALALGETWRASGKLIYLMFPLVLGKIMFSPLSILFLVASKQSWNLMRQMFFLCLVLGSFWYGKYMENVQLSLVLYSISGFSCYLYDGFITHEISRGVVK